MNDLSIVLQKEVDLLQIRKWQVSWVGPHCNLHLFHLPLVAGLYILFALRCNGGW